MRITVTDNESGAVLYSGKDPEAAQQAVDANGQKLPSLAIQSGKDENNVIGPEAAIDDEIDAEDCDVEELVYISNSQNAKVLFIFMSPAHRERKAS